MEKTAGTKTKQRRGGRRRANGQGAVYPVETPAGRRWIVKVDDERNQRIARRFKTEAEALVAVKSAVER
jgi:hypothetical protein